MKEKNKKSWEVVRSEKGPDLGLFKTRYDWLKNPRNSHTIKAVVLESADWVNVVAITPEKKILTVKQFRFGVSQTTIEIPAGLMDEGETPQQAAMRELKEETGYVSDNWRYLGWFQANPAFMNNICHSWLAQDAIRKYPPQPDEGEEISIAELSLDEIRKEIEQGNMRNSLSLVALSQVFDIKSI
jgi:8-oxo-dGTP pyrophosphatase MutT (NUDIX family)